MNLNKKLKYRMVSIDTMNRQINLRMSDKLLRNARSYAKKNGYGTVQELIKETVREKLFGPEITKEEGDLINIFLKNLDNPRLWSTEKELFEIVKSKSKCTK